MDLLNINYTETDSGLPGLLINNDLTFVIDNISFAKSFTSFMNSDMLFKLGGLSGNKLSFKIVDDTEDAEIVAIYYNRMLVGNVEVRVLAEIMFEIHAVLCRLGLDKKSKKMDYLD